MYISAFYEANKYSWHAEQSCIRNCNNKKLISKSIMILVKLTKGIKDVKPCTMCDHIIHKYKVRRIKCIAIYD
jgi:cytidine deaminase